MKDLKRSFLLFAFCLIIFSNYSFGQVINSDTLNLKSAQKWYEGRSWLPANVIKPHSSINILELAKQYYKNKIYWDKALNFLANPNLDKMEMGKYNIDSTFVVATISYAENADTSKANWEIHRKYLDLQYLISGNASFGIAPLIKTSEIKPYNETGDIEYVTTNSGKFYLGTPGTLFVFFPSDAHKPAIKKAVTDSVKRVVVKVIYKY